jgi:hypothetical protein
MKLLYLSGGVQGKDIRARDWRQGPAVGETNVDNEEVAARVAEVTAEVAAD